MKNFLLKIIIISGVSFFLGGQGFGQYAKLIVRFTDKENSPYSLGDPSKYLSPKAVRRRIRYNIPIDSSDLPVNPSYIKRVLNQGPVTYLSQSKWLNQILVHCTDSGTIAAIRKLRFVQDVQPVGPSRTGEPSRIHKFEYEKIAPLSGQSEIPQFNEPTCMNYGGSYDQIHIHNGEFLHDKGFMGEGITIAVIDAGFYHYRTIVAFDSVRRAGHFLGEKDFVDFDNNVNEDDSHGENCLSTIAANIPGVMVGTAPHARFWLLRSENTASEYPIEEHNWVAAAEFADSAGADMISSSLGYSRFDDPSFDHTYADFYKNATMVSKGASYAAKKGMIVTNSAGNEGDNTWKYLLFPADDDSVCAVGAIDIFKKIAEFSSFGYPGKIKPNIVSVGVNTVIYTTAGTSYGSGTSFSNANINGLIACLWQAFPKFNNMTILNAVYQSCNRDSNPNLHYGFGIPNMKKAYRILKARQNRETFGNEWLFAGVDANKVHVKLIGRVDGPASLKVFDEHHVAVANVSMSTEKEEVYDKDLGIRSPGRYTVQYSDASVSREIVLDDQMETSWLKAAPVPFQNELAVQLESPETGKISVRLVDALGNILQRKELNVEKNKFYNIQFDHAGALHSGTYYVQFKGLEENRTIKIVK